MSLFSVCEKTLFLLGCSLRKSWPGKSNGVIREGDRKTEEIVLGPYFYLNRRKFSLFKNLSFNIILSKQFGQIILISLKKKIFTYYVHLC